MSVLCVIPARYGSKRFPGKALASDTGRPLIQHVHEVASRASRIDRVVVATDDERIVRAVEDFGGEARVTRSDHACGTDRVAEVAKGFPDARVIINFQCDEPELDPAWLDRLVEVLEADASVDLATLAGPLEAADAADPNHVKVVLASSNDALYFSRAAIPCARDGEASRQAPLRLHVGIYAFQADALAEFAALGPSPLDQTERLEQLRWLEAGRSIRVLEMDASPRGINTPEDYAAFVARWRASPSPHPSPARRGGEEEARRD